MKTAWEIWRENFKINDKIVLVDENENLVGGILSDESEDGCWVKDFLKKEEFFYRWEDIKFIAHDGFPVKKLLGADGSRSIEKIDTSAIQEAIRESFSSSGDYLGTIKSKEGYERCNNCSLYVRANNLVKVQHLAYLHMKPNIRRPCSDFETEECVFCIDKENVIIQRGLIARVKAFVGGDSKKTAKAKTFVKGDPPKRVKSIVYGDPFLIEDVVMDLYNKGMTGPRFDDTPYEECLVMSSKDGAKAILYQLGTVYHIEKAV